MTVDEMMNRMSGREYEGWLQYFQSPPEPTAEEVDAKYEADELAMKNAHKMRLEATKRK